MSLKIYNSFDLFIGGNAMNFRPID